MPSDAESAKGSAIVALWCEYKQNLREILETIGSKLFDEGIVLLVMATVVAYGFLPMLAYVTLGEVGVITRTSTNLIYAWAVEALWVGFVALPSLKAVDEVFLSD